MYMPSILPRRNHLRAAIAAHLFLAAAAQAGPTGGEVTGGSGTVNQDGHVTTITQNTDRLALNWDTFNVATHESVRFDQPTSTSLALNRILDNNGSRILGQIDANGRIILMNPNGIFFGTNATVNVGALIATGLSIDSDDFMNGDIVLQAAGATAGTVLNRGTINAATGGNVALVGTQVVNSGLISANLGNVALASGQEAVITFDEQGLMGLRIDRETLQTQLGAAAGVTNRGRINASGGKILLTGSVSENLFSRAVNAGDLTSGTGAIVHADGSFTLGASVDAINTGTLDVTSAGHDAGTVMLAGRDVTHRGVIIADHTGAGDAGTIHLQANEGTVRLAGRGSLSASSSSPSPTDTVFLSGAAVTGSARTRITTTGTTSIYSQGATRIPSMQTTNLTVSSAGTLNQAAPLTIADTLHLELGDGARANLNNNRNDFDTLSMTTGRLTTASIVDTKDITLGNLQLSDSNLRVRSSGTGGTITQADASSIELGNGALRLSGDNLQLGGGSSHTSIEGGRLQLFFTQEAKINSVDLPGELNGSQVNLIGTAHSDRVVAVGDAGPFSAEISLNSYEEDIGGFGMNIAKLNARSATFTTQSHVTQTGPISLTGTLDLMLTAGGTVDLRNPLNDFTRVNMDLGHTTVVDLADANDVTLGNVSALDSSVRIASVGAITQARDTRIDLSDSFVAVEAANVLLGNKSNSSLNLHGYSWLDANFTEAAHIVGASTVTSPEDYFTPFTARGSDGASTLYAEGLGTFELRASIDDTSFNIAGLNGSNASLNAINRVSQSGAIKLTDTLDMVLAADADVRLTDSDNDFNIVAVQASYTSNASIVDKDDVALGPMTIGDSNVEIIAAGSIDQATSAEIHLSDSSLRLDGKNIRLGRHNDGSGITLSNSWLEILFQNQVHIDESIQTAGEYDFSWINVTGSSYPNEISLAQDSAVDIVAAIDDREGIRIDKLVARDAAMTTVDDITQNGPISLNGTLDLSLPAGGSAQLTHEDNDINVLTMTTGYTTHVKIVDSNDLVIGDWSIEDSSITIQSAGAGGTISQAANSDIVGFDSSVDLIADHIDLGANGTSGIRVLGIGILNNTFAHTLSLNGALQLGSYYSGFSAVGNDNTNTLTVGEYADFQLGEPDFFDYLINLGDGADDVYLLNDAPIPFATGPGNDVIYISDADTQYTAEDFDPAQDKVIIQSP